MRSWGEVTMALMIGIAVLGSGRARAEDHSAHDPSAHGGSPTVGHPAPPNASTGVPGMAEVEVPVDRRQLVGVRTEQIGARSLTQRLRTVGVVAPDERRVRKIQTRVSGWVQELFVSFTGQRVAAGERILSLYSPELLTAQREYLLARSAGSGPEARRLVEAARTRLRLWQVTDAQIADLERSGTPQQTVVLHSPIAGFVTLKPVAQGMYVTPEMELYTVTDLDQVWVWADVYEPEAGLVTPGSPATITLASVPASPRTAVVSYINPMLDTATRTVRVRLDVANPDGRLKPGTYATVDLDSPLGELLAIPEDAVIDTGLRRVVFVQLDDARYQPRVVRLGRRAEGYFEVLDGLVAGERVVVSAQFLLDSESRLRATTGGPTHGGH